MLKTAKSVSNRLKTKIITIIRAARVSLTTPNCWNQSMWIKWITSTSKISKKPIWHWNAKSKKWLNSKKMDLINLWSKKILKTNQIFKKLILSKKVNMTVRKVGWWMKTQTSSSLESWVPSKRFQTLNNRKKTIEKEI